MDTSTSEISAEPDGEHNSSLLSNCENFSYNEISVSSEKNIQSASCSSNMEVDEAPFSHRTGDFLPPFNSSISSGDICLNDVGVKETVSVRDIDSLTEKPVRDNSEFDLLPPLNLSNSSGDICLNDVGIVETVSVRDIDTLTEKPVSDNSEFNLAKIITNRGTNPFSEFSDFVPLEHVESVLKVDTEVKTEIEDVAECEIPPEPCVSKLELLSEDEINFDGISRKSCAESSSSKDGSPSEPSCSGTSRTGLHSLSSDSEDDLPSINIPLPFKKRKREKPVEIISSSSCSEDEKSDIDYANLTPEQIKALIEQAKRYGRVKRCKCPKKKWSELPIKGPTQGSGKCTIGKGDWSESVSEPCQECAGGTCNDNRHKRGRHGRRRVQHTRSILSKSRARGTIGLDVPIIELSDSEEVTPASTTVVSEVTISAVPSGECIVLSSSEDDDDIVCEGVIQAEVKAQATEPEVTAKHSRPDVVVLNTSAAPVHSSFPYFSQSTSVFPSLSTAPLCPPVTLPTHPVTLGPDSETWPDLNVDLENWDVTMNLLANICGPPSTDGLLGNDSRVIPTPPERPPTPEGWSCPICLESKTAVNEIMSTTCGHVFCGNCIRSAVRIHKKCPTCRKKLTMKQFHKIFL